VGCWGVWAAMAVDQAERFGPVDQVERFGPVGPFREPF